MAHLRLESKKLFYRRILGRCLRGNTHVLCLGRNLLLFDGKDLTRVVSILNRHGRRVVLGTVLEEGSDKGIKCMSSKNSLTEQQQELVDRTEKDVADCNAALKGVHAGLLRLLSSSSFSFARVRFRGAR